LLPLHDTMLLLSSLLFPFPNDLLFPPAEFFLLLLVSGEFLLLLSAGLLLVPLRFWS